MWNFRATRIVPILLLISAFWASSSLAGGYPINLELVSPIPSKGKSNKAKPRDNIIQFRAGWPLTLRLTIEDEDMVGIGSFSGPNTDQFSVFPEIGQGGAIVLEDPDGCYYSSPLSGCSAPDETLMPFFLDQDMYAVNDVSSSGPSFAQMALQDPLLRPAYGGPFIYGDLPEDDEAIYDGWGWGADDDLPGLVILANVGGSLVMQDEKYDAAYVPGAPGFGDPVVPARVRNSAGFINMVGYELNTSKGNTTITASMLVPRHLYSNTRLIDYCVGDWELVNGTRLVCSGGKIQRIDGGPEQPFDNQERINTVVELRAFVIAPPLGLPPEVIHVLEDKDGDGKVTMADAELDGHMVISNEVVIEFTQILNSTGWCNGIERPDKHSGDRLRGTDVYVDLDGNGIGIPLSVQCPPGGGGIGEVPR